MNPAAAAAQAELASRVLAKRRLLHFIQRLNPQYKAGWVHEDICRRLEKFSDDVAAGKSPRLMILMPPRAGKSEIASRMFPPWHLGRYPDHEIISCSYNIGLTMTFSRKIKEAINDPAYRGVFPETQLKSDQQSTEEWGIQDRRGGYVAAGVGGGITGKGCFSLDTTVQTPRGTMRLADAQVGDKVLVHDFRRGQDAFVPILAIHAQRHAHGTGVFAGVRCTADHPLYSPATQRYHPAAEVQQQGLPVMRRQESGWLEGVRGVRETAPPAAGEPANVPLVRAEEGVPRAGMPYVPPQGDNAAASAAGVRALSGGVFAGQGRGGQALASLLGRLLQPFVRAGRTGAAQGSRLVRLLWQAAGKPRPEDLLQPLVLRPEAAGAAVHAGVPGWIPASTQPHSSARRAHVRHDRCDAGAGGAPHRPRPDEQRRGEPDHVIEEGARAVSLHAGCTAGALATHVRRTDSEPHVVVDIQTPTGNFFADGVLAHNCHILVIDDPLKNAEEADSADNREKLWDWYGSTAYTRLAPGGGVLCIQTTWHDDDLAGRLQLAMKDTDDPFVDQFVVIKYPAIAEADEYLDYETDLIVYDREPANGRLLRRKGEALHPERYTADMLLKIKKTIPARWWSALYQQNPVPDDGGYFTKDQFRRSMAPSLRKSHVFVAFDFAISEKKINDYTVGFVGLQDENDTIHIVDRERFKSGDSLFIVDAMLNLCNRWHNPSIVLGVEDGQIWRSMEAVFKRRMVERVREGTLKGYVAIQVLKPLTDKLTRARTLQARMQQGLISFVENAEWYDSARLEMLRFPAGVHDDQVDSLAWMAQLAVGRTPPREKSARIASWKDRLASGFTSANSGYLTA